MKRVLIVDDHDLFRQVLAVVLRQYTALSESVQVESLAEARRVLGGPSGGIDLAIVDLDTPGGGGDRADQGAPRCTARPPGTGVHGRPKLRTARPGVAGRGEPGAQHGDPGREDHPCSGTAPRRVDDTCLFP